jgi:hypothetical protein
MTDLLGLLLRDQGVPEVGDDFRHLGDADFNLGSILLINFGRKLRTKL